MTCLHLAIDVFAPGKRAICQVQTNVCSSGKKSICPSVEMKGKKTIKKLFSPGNSLRYT